eukprot:Unigene6451_Nuclearia_a/m.19871 Unigene6451_Nuclearia_a/g.19871  ORF Unigene6451_Nuclearia_a/g.19871 Unigene6451_Nuclearia_a/m.19871 type:complete len:305 (+) Unigene6451_Nuclearia_a:1804-2718(+)
MERLGVLCALALPDRLQLLVPRVGLLQQLVLGAQVHDGVAGALEVALDLRRRLALFAQLALVLQQQRRVLGRLLEQLRVLLLKPVIRARGDLQLLGQIVGLGAGLGDEDALFEQLVLPLVRLLPQCHHQLLALRLVVVQARPQVLHLALRLLQLLEQPALLRRGRADLLALLLLELGDHVVVQVALAHDALNDSLLSLARCLELLDLRHGVFVQPPCLALSARKRRALGHVRLLAQLAHDAQQLNVALLQLLHAAERHQAGGDHAAGLARVLVVQVRHRAPVAEAERRRVHLAQQRLHLAAEVA